ncbi:MAG: rhodanese-like domain-containing protein [Mariprofundaceae bacterium]|nr:rhodanese-like domain-containing protein [Mariprofundaceae bacterium]
MKRIIFLMVAAVALFSFNASACGLGEQVDGYENTDVKHAYTHWSAGEKSPVPFLFIDVRTPEEYSESHIKGAKLIPLQELLRQIAEVPGDRQVYLYCHSGRRSAAAAEILAKAGYSNIENIEGGITAWKEAGYPVVK